jgi:hypothetical protein
LLTDFYFLDQNHTSNGNQIQLDFFNITGIIATSFAETLIECYQFEEDAILDTFGNNIFVDEKDFRTSFLFNLLASSIMIRSYAYDLLKYSEDGEEDWVEYTYSLAAILSYLIYFTSTTA